jgi:acetyl esterase/lipase
MVQGDAIYSDIQNEIIARECNLAVISVNYRLAPEHPYPAAPDDCEAVALWLTRNSQSEFGTDLLIIGGESAGANLAAVSLLRLRDLHQLQPFRAANLVFGVYDFAGTPSCGILGQTTIALNARRMAWYARNYMADADRLREPDISPLWADLSGMPPALFTVGTLDPLLDDSIFMHGRWLAAGNQSEIAVYPGGTHLFITQPTPTGRQAFARIRQFLKAAADA